MDKIEIGDWAVAGGIIFKVVNIVEGPYGKCDIVGEYKHGNTTIDLTVPLRDVKLWTENEGYGAPVKVYVCIWTVQPENIIGTMATLGGAKEFCRNHAKESDYCDEDLATRWNYFPPNYSDLKIWKSYDYRIEEWTLLP